MENNRPPVAYGEGKPFRCFWCHCSVTRDMHEAVMADQDEEVEEIGTNSALEVMDLVRIDGDDDLFDDSENQTVVICGRCNEMAKTSLRVVYPMYGEAAPGAKEVYKQLQQLRLEAY